jgi:hypothetical protein
VIRHKLRRIPQKNILSNLFKKREGSIMFKPSKQVPLVAIDERL